MWRCAWKRTMLHKINTYFIAYCVFIQVYCVLRFIYRLVLLCIINFIYFIAYCVFTQTRAAMMGTCGWWAARWSTRGEWKCAVTRCGVPCVTTPGAPMTLLWSVDSWDTLLRVSSAGPEYSIKGAAIGRLWTLSLILFIIILHNSIIKCYYIFNLSFWCRGQSLKLCIFTRRVYM